MCGGFPFVSLLFRKPLISLGQCKLNGAKVVIYERHKSGVLAVNNINTGI